MYFLMIFVTLVFCYYLKTECLIFSSKVKFQRRSIYCVPTSDDEENDDLNFDFIDEIARDLSVEKAVKQMVDDKNNASMTSPTESFKNLYQVIQHIFILLTDSRRY